MAGEAGFTPWEGEYADKLNVGNVGLSATKTLNISSGFTIIICTVAAAGIGAVLFPIKEEQA